jgi:hypothetical protein
VASSGPELSVPAVGVLVMHADNLSEVTAALAKATTDSLADVVADVTKHAQDKGLRVLPASLEIDAIVGLDHEQLSVEQVVSAAASSGTNLLYLNRKVVNTDTTTAVMREAAESWFERSLNYDVAGFLFSPSQFDRLAGSCYLFLGDHRRAQAVLEKTARGTQPQNKSLAIVQGNLCLAHLRQGDLDGATNALHDAIDVVEETRGGGGLNIVFDAGRQLRRWRSEQVVNEVYDRLLSLMTAA